MKRNMSSESMTTLSPNSSDEKNQENNLMKDFETMLEGMDDEESCQVLSQKKRRLHIDQVRALEKNFEVDDKLDPDRKVKLAREVGLQPRQVAIWFQNRRARWKTKKMEKDYVSLKANYDNLKLGFEKLQQENTTLLREISEMKSKLNELSSKPGELLSDTEDKTKMEGADELNFDKFSESILNMKDGSSDSDSSAIFNDDNNNPGSSGGVYLHQPFAKLDFFEDESCGSLIFAEDQAPALHWYLE